jgi:hypothetical protein
MVAARLDERRVLVLRTLPRYPVAWSECKPGGEMLRRGPSTHVATALVNELQSRVGTEAVELTQIGTQHPKSHFSHFKL